ncbi:DUF6867 family protein [Aureimonas sp. AU40]|uniref:DUF6867 family protein n=1 Tax=Aureimonas sp. AU40 TaxID=1637747 RepID=UPI000784D3A1|nr:hypothetical protein [Aureimonas sp. AU40]
MNPENALLWEVSLVEFVIVTLVIGGGLAFAVGRSSARSWGGWSFLVFGVALLTLAIRFLHFSLFHGSFFLPPATFGTALHYGLVDFVILLAFAAAGRVTMRSAQMARQYRFLSATGRR